MFQIAEPRLLRATAKFHPDGRPVDFTREHWMSISRAKLSWSRRVLNWLNKIDRKQPDLVSISLTDQANQRNPTMTCNTNTELTTWKIRTPSFSFLRLVRHLGAIQRQRQSLRELDRAALDDIGLTRSQADAEASRPVWDVPANRPVQTKQSHQIA